MSETKKATPTTIPVSEKPAKIHTKNNTSTIAKCDCKNEYQDKLYGKGMRLKNSTGSGYRCTVCRTVK